MNCGALILSRLTWSTLKVFEKTEIPTKFISDNPIKLNADSTTVLSSIQAPAINYKTFVKNKIIEIQNLVPSSNWKYVPSGKNKAADLLSMGGGGNPPPPIQNLLESWGCENPNFGYLEIRKLGILYSQ